LACSRSNSLGCRHPRGRFCRPRQNGSKVNLTTLGQNGPQGWVGVSGRLFPTRAVVVPDSNKPASSKAQGRRCHCGTGRAPGDLAALRRVRHRSHTRDGRAAIAVDSLPVCAGATDLPSQDTTPRWSDLPLASPQRRAATCPRGTSRPSAPHPQSFSVCPYPSYNITLLLCGGVY
jgi:hypothetical protein